MNGFIKWYLRTQKSCSSALKNCFQVKRNRLPRTGIIKPIQPKYMVFYKPKEREESCRFQGRNIFFFSRHFIQKHLYGGPISAFCVTWFLFQKYVILRQFEWIWKLFIYNILYLIYCIYLYFSIFHIFIYHMLLWNYKY